MKAIAAITSTMAVTLGLGILAAPASFAVDSAGSKEVAGTHSRIEQIVVDYDIPGWYGKPLPGYKCPTDAPYLLDENLSGARKVPHGVLIYASDGIDVTIEIGQDKGVRKDADGYVIGWQQALLNGTTNWFPTTGHLTIKAACVSDRSLGYKSQHR